MARTRSGDPGPHPRGIPGGPVRVAPDQEHRRQAVDHPGRGGHGVRRRHRRRRWRVVTEVLTITFIFVSLLFISPVATLRRRRLLRRSSLHRPAGDPAADPAASQRNLESLTSGVEVVAAVTDRRQGDQAPPARTSPSSTSSRGQRAGARGRRDASLLGRDPEVLPRDRLRPRRGAARRRRRSGQQRPRTASRCSASSSRPAPGSCPARCGSSTRSPASASPGRRWRTWSRRTGCRRARREEQAAVRDRRGAAGRRARARPDLRLRRPAGRASAPRRGPRHPARSHPSRWWVPAVPASRTFVDILLGLHRPSAGTITAGGVHLRQPPRLAAAASRSSRRTSPCSTRHSAPTSPSTRRSTRPASPRRSSAPSSAT